MSDPLFNTSSLVYGAESAAPFPSVAAHMLFACSFDTPSASIRRLVRCVIRRGRSAARVVFNDALALRRRLRAAGEPYPSDTELQRRVITEGERSEERAFPAEVSSLVLVQALGDLNAAYRNFIGSITGQRKGARVGEPRFRSRKDNRQTIRFTRNGFSLRPDGSLYLAKIGEVAVRWWRDLPSEPSSVTVVKDASGRYFASFVVRTDSVEDLERFPTSEREVGIDLGLASFAVLSDGAVIENPRYLRRAEKKLKDFHHKLSMRIVAENRGVYVEDLAVAALGRTRLAKSVHDAGWSQFTHMLEHKAARYGREFGKVDRWAPASQVCSNCGFSDGRKPLHVRTWICGGCATEHDRDVNAVLNILALGRRERRNACRGPGGPRSSWAPAGEAGTRRDDRTRPRPA
ncbi:MAG TPA: RNA-guided endonuclease TnpB family protein [Actinospica sp.]|nr:RNA-guided endonuclease TnpB family protein [Actinospica sp.]